MKDGIQATLGDLPPGVEDARFFLAAPDVARDLGAIFAVFERYTEGIDLVGTSVLI